MAATLSPLALTLMKSSATSPARPAGSSTPTAPPTATPPLPLPYFFYHLLFLFPSFYFYFPSLSKPPNMSSFPRVSLLAPSAAPAGEVPPPRPPAASSSEAIAPPRHPLAASKSETQCFPRTWLAVVGPALVML